MKILFYGTKSYDIESFENEINNYEDLEITFIEHELDNHSVNFANGYDAICVFVNNEVDRNILNRLYEMKIKLILLRSAGYNNIDLDACREYNITVMRVSFYSPEAVAEMAMALALAVNRKIHKSYIKIRENNFSLSGLTGINFHKKTVGIVGTGKIGVAMARICEGFGMNVIAYDRFETKDFNYVSFDELLEQADLISLHCPLTDETYHMINENTIDKMKDGVILVNTSRGGLINTEDLIKGIRNKKFFGVALDVYEEEDEYVFENFEDNILDFSTIARLLSFPNVIVTSHQGFLTKEALEAISKITLENAKSYKNSNFIKENIVCNEISALPTN